MDEPLLRSVLREGPECFSIEELSTRLELEPRDPARVAAELHMSGCLHCRTEMELLREFEAGTILAEEAAPVRWITAQLKQEDEEPVRERPARWFGEWRLPRMAWGFAGVAVAALLAVGISTEWNVKNRLERPVPEFGNETLRSKSVTVVVHPGYFEWQPVAGAVRYELTVGTLNQPSIFHNSFTGTSSAFPPEVDGVYKAGKLLEWQVVARDSAGKAIAESGVQRLRISSEQGH